MIKPSHHLHWKHLVLGALALGAGPWLARADYATEVTSRSPIAYYRLNETIATSGTAVNAGSLGVSGDGAYGSHVAHPTGGALPSQTGNGAASFCVPTEASAAANSRVAVPFQAGLNVAGPFTVELWAKPTDTSSGCPMSSIVPGNSGWLFYNNALTAGRWSFRIINSASANVNATGGTVTVGAWQHVAGVWDGTQIILYVNGAPVATNASATFKPVTDAVTALTIGVRSDNGFNFKGSLDKPGYYANALGAAQILAHYQAGTNPAPPPPTTWRSAMTPRSATGG